MIWHAILPVPARIVVILHEYWRSCEDRMHAAVVKYFLQGVYIMAGLSCFSYLRVAQSVRRHAHGFRFRRDCRDTVWSLGFLASCANADTTNYVRISGESDDWVGSLSRASWLSARRRAGWSTATLTVMCNHQPTVEETMTGPFVPGSGHYHAVVTGIKTAPNFSYDQDKNFDLTLAADGCTMSGTVTDGDGSSNISFDSSAQDCP